MGSQNDSSFNSPRGHLLAGLQRELFSQGGYITPQLFQPELNLLLPGSLLQSLQSLLQKSNANREKNNPIKIILEVYG